MAKSGVILWVPADRLLAVIEKADELNHRLTENEKRFVFDLRNERQEFVSLARADRLLTRLDLQDWWHYRKEDGGLSDIYNDGKQYGAPNRLRLSDGRPTSTKYETDEERQAARKESYRRAYLRRKMRRAA